MCEKFKDFKVGKFYETFIHWGGVGGIFELFITK